MGEFKRIKEYFIIVLLIFMSWVIVNDFLVNKAIAKKVGVTVEDITDGNIFRKIAFIGLD